MSQIIFFNRYFLNIIDINKQVQRMDILYNNNLIDEIVDKLFRHKRSDYSEFNLQHLLYLAEIQHQVHRVVNQNYEKLYASLFRRGNNQDTCIVFMHGYGSNRLQCTNILKVLPQRFALCSFDFSGCGKSEGDMITYGMKEKEDINSIINYLRQMEFKKFILWGRSMGATSSLLYCQKYKPEDVIIQIIDSAFYSFEMIAFQIANKNVKAPQFIISFALQMAKKNCSKFRYNPFSIELTDIGQCNTNALFLYHEEDSVINCQNTHLICSKYKGIFEKFIIEENHNTVRSAKTIDSVFSFIEKYQKKSKNAKPLTLNFDYQPSLFRSIGGTPKRKESKGQKSIDQVSKKSSKKGIQRIQYGSAGKDFDDYGGWMKKFKIEFPSTPNEVSDKRKTGSLKRTHLTLSSPYANKDKVNKSDISQFSINQAIKDHNEGFQPNIITMASQKQRKSRKLATVKSLGVSRCLNRAKVI